MPARKTLVLLAALLAAASCAKKPVATPAVPGAPRFAEFVFPSGPESLGSSAIWERHTAAWRTLQSGDTRAADREFAAILKTAPDFYPAEAGLGYSGLARKDAQGALTHFDKALSRNPAYASALAGKGDALLSLDRVEQALAAFEAALAADPGLTAIRSRVDVLRFRGMQQNIESARKAASAGRLDEARRQYMAAIAASPQSAFLYRELAAAERGAGDTALALVHAEQAVALDPSDTRALLMIAELREAGGQWARAADGYAALQAVEPNDAVAAKIDQMRERAAFDELPEEYRSIESAPSITRGQLAALLGVRLEDLIGRARSSSPAVLTDVRGHWAAPWILAVTRAGVMEPFPNHTFQPEGALRRADLAQAVSRVLALIAAEQPRLAAKWRDARVRFSDVSPSHLHYSAAARAVAAGIMAPAAGEAFELSRLVTGAEAGDVVARLAALAKK